MDLTVEFINSTPPNHWPFSPIRPNDPIKYEPPYRGVILAAATDCEPSTLQRFYYQLKK